MKNSERAAYGFTSVNCKNREQMFSKYNAEVYSVFFLSETNEAILYRGFGIYQNISSLLTRENQLMIKDADLKVEPILLECENLTKAPIPHEAVNIIGRGNINLHIEKPSYQRQNSRNHVIFELDRGCWTNHYILQDRDWKDFLEKWRCSNAI